MKDNFIKRKKRVRAKISGTTNRPRLVVFRSNKFLYVQAIDDQKGHTIASVGQKDLKKTEMSENKLDMAKNIGKKMAEELKKKKVKTVVFDKSGYKYHGKVKAIADGAREGGLKF